MPRPGPHLASLLHGHTVRKNAEEAFQRFFEQAKELSRWRDLEGVTVHDFAGDRFQVAYASVAVEFRLHLGMGEENRPIGVVSAWTVDELPKEDPVEPLVAFAIGPTGRVVPDPTWRQGGLYAIHEDDAVEIAACALGAAMRRVYSMVTQAGPLPVAAAAP